MEKFIISIDLDGTALNKKGKLSLLTTLGLKHLLENGHYVIINTGRPYQGISEFVKKLHLFNYPLICSNGECIYYLSRNYEIVKSYPNFIDNDILVKLFTNLKDKLIYSYFQGEKDAYFFNKPLIPDYFIHEAKGVKLEEIFSFENLKDIIGGSFALKKEYADWFEKNYKKGKFDFLNLTHWDDDNQGNCYYDFAACNVNKKTTLDKLAQKLKIKEDHILAFGDELNDVPMIVGYKNGYLMDSSRLKDHPFVDIDKDKIIPYHHDKNGLIKFLFKHYRFLF